MMPKQPSLWHSSGLRGYPFKTVPGVHVQEKRLFIILVHPLPLFFVKCKNKIPLSFLCYALGSFCSLAPSSSRPWRAGVLPSPGLCTGSSILLPVQQLALLASRCPDFQQKQKWLWLQHFWAVMGCCTLCVRTASHGAHGCLPGCVWHSAIFVCAIAKMLKASIIV